MLHAILMGWTHAAKRPGVFLIAYVINGLFALAAVTPLFLYLVSIGGQQPLDILPGGFYGMLHMTDLITGHREGLVITFFISVFLGGLYMLVSQWLTLGVMGAYWKQQQPLGLAFWGTLGQSFWAAVRLLLLAIPLYFFVVVVVWLALNLLESQIPNAAGWLGLVTFFSVLAVGLFLVNRVMDYARAHAIISGRFAMTKAMLSGISFCCLRLYAIVPVTLAFVLPILALTYGWTLLKEGVSGLLILFVLAQIHMLWRIFGRCALYAGELQLYHHYHPALATDNPTGETPPVRRDQDKGFWDGESDHPAADETPIEASPGETDDPHGKDTIPNSPYQGGVDERGWSAEDNPDPNAVSGVVIPKKGEDTAATKMMVHNPNPEAPDPIAYEAPEQEDYEEGFEPLDLDESPEPDEEERPIPAPQPLDPPAPPEDPEPNPEPEEDNDPDINHHDPPLMR